MKKNRPEFKDINSFEEFIKYYWYREELSKICKDLGIEYKGTKKELNSVIKQYFLGNFIKVSKNKKNIKMNTNKITKNTPLLECNFSFNSKFREYFSKLTDIEPFKFNANMATAWRKVKKENDKTFTIQDMLDVYYGKSGYAKYDNSECKWNQFLKDFCADEKSMEYSNKLKVASILWKEIKHSTKNKVYTTKLLNLHFQKIKKYHK